MKKSLALPYAALAALAVGAGWPHPAFAQSTTAAARTPVVVQAPADAWPRPVALPGAAALVYAPQVERWTGNRIDFRAAVAVRPTGAATEAFGTVTVSAATRVDKVARTVTLDGLAVTASDFPTLPDRGATYAAGLARQLPATVRTVCADINPAVVTKLADRGSFQAIGIVTDVGLFVEQLADELDGAAR